MLSKTVIWFLAALAVARATPFPARVQLFPPRDGKIVGGSVIAIQDVPHQVSLLRSGFHFCGGSIIDSEYVVTAGHCASYAKGGQVRAGSNFTNTGGSLHKIVKVILHEQYGTRSHGEPVNDIAILRVDPPFVVDATRVPINLYFDESDISVGEMCTVSGYGSTREGGSSSAQLMAVSVPIVSREECSKIYTSHGLSAVDDMFICAGTHKGGKDSCQGDSGGPVVVNGQLAGIVSYGLGCARPGIPGVYTNVAHYTKWIAQHSRV